MFVSKETVGQKKIGTKTFVGQKSFWSEKFLVKKILVQKFFTQKKWVGLTQGEGCASPQPHQHPENSRVEIELGYC